MHFCRNCGGIGAGYIVPRELVEQQLGWRLDIPHKRKLAERQRQEDLKYDTIHLCKDCLLGILRTEMATATLLSRD